MPKLERRYLAHEFRVADGDSPIISGYAAKFGVRSEDFGGWVEVIAPTAFDASLAADPDVRALFNHDPSLILGRTRSGTLKLSKDATGLAYEVQPPETQAARDLIVSMRRGDVTQSSFGFIATDTSWGYDELTGLEVRTVKAAELFDVSPVTFPAYPQATSGVRGRVDALPADMPAEVRSRLATRDASDVDCECTCEPCVEGTCEACSHEGCDCAGCDCPQSRSRRSTARCAVSAGELHRMHMRLRLAHAGR